MNNRAQVSVEYLIIISLLVFMSLFVAAVSLNFFSAKGAVMAQAEVLRNGSLEMLK